MSFCHEAHCTICGLCYMTPRAASVVLLLLVIKTCLGCNFTEHSPISSTFDDTIKKLLKYLPWDYNVSVIANLQPHSQCSDLWMVYFLRKELVRIEGVSGERLKEQVADMRGEMEFIQTECHFNVSEDCRMQKKNVTDFLGIMSSTMNHMAAGNRIKADFSSCAMILCKKDTSVNNTVQHQRHNGTKDCKQPEKEQNSRVHTIAIPIAVGLVIVLLVVVVFVQRQLCCNKITDQRTEESREGQRVSSCKGLE
ncbi:hypothetical protein XENTR_v10019350 [Xenopus tropicalis]|uniref:Fms-related tyrosine kinase 3 ligand isoform X1 n=1 Tax=Xenopus tropicalis TaxID=8364 RepID=A0A8J0SVC5_XENTR|eukprot:XP_012822942.1 PREDICTED: fms-related tyrosine kinase 3 ligand [Xenopus tropicalis]